MSPLPHRLIDSETSTHKTPRPRQTRNSLHGRQPPPPRTARNSDKGRAPATQTRPPMQDGVAQQNGVPVHVGHSNTGKATHSRWLHPEWQAGWQRKPGTDEVEDVDDMTVMTVGGDVNGRLSTPQPGPSNQVPRTPLPVHPFHAGSVIRTPVKKAKPLQRSPERIGDKGIRHLYARDAHQPLYSSVDLTKEQVEQMQQAAADRITLEQMAKLKAQKEAVDREDEEDHYDDEEETSDEMDVDEPLVQRRVRTVGPDGTIVITDEREYGVGEATEQPFVTGPNGEKLDLQGQQLVGPDGTLLFDGTFNPPRRGLGVPRPLKPTPTELIYFPDAMLETVRAEEDKEQYVQRRQLGDNTATTAAQRNTRRLTRQLAVGPEGTELIWSS
ncbi:hypothetical protein F5I97DRAFT_372243 [Phlebopus sp. FC_14]|nr:hypothetical protein F5I97DRAFT_372243 [Phlebopus sp. FC_14]